MRKLVYAFLIVGALSLAGCTLPQMVKMRIWKKSLITPLTM